jgi:hypothetical protein
VDLLINEVSCQQVTTGGVELRGPVVTVIVSTPVTLPDGTAADYVLFYATDNPIQFAALKRLGWPVDLLRQASSGSVTRDDTGQIDSLHLTVLGSGWDHELTVLATAPVGEPEQSTAVYYRDVDGALLKLCYENNLDVVPATVTGDLRETPLASITSFPPNLTPALTAGHSWLAVGSQRSTLTSGSCPA